MKVTKDVLYVGVNDHNIDLFEGQYVVPNGMAYNSYFIHDNKIAVIDSVDHFFAKEWLDNISSVLNGKTPDYLIIQHMEPDHSGSIAYFMDKYPNTTIVGNATTMKMLDQFFTLDEKYQRLVVKNGDTLELGTHTLTFVFAPMVHWPEVMVTYDAQDKILFSADAFGKFGALDVEEDWACEARRYYFGIVGKYGTQVQTLLKKIDAFDVQIICPLHGPVLTDHLPYYLNLYQTWSSYGIENDGVVIAYTSVYGNTKKAVELLAKLLEEKGCPKVSLFDLARDDMAEAVEDAFRYGKLVLATTTYNGNIFPFMKEFIHHLTEKNFQNRTVGFIENGTWAPIAKKVMKEMLQDCKNLTYLDNEVTIHSSMKDDCKKMIEAMADELSKEYIAKLNEQANNINMKALYNIGYGLYVVTSHDGKQDNGLIVNTVLQVSDSPNRVAVNINKANYSHDVIKMTGKMNVNCLSVDAPFELFERFGFQSGRTVHKFEDFEPLYSNNKLAYLPHYINGFMSLEVEQYVDLNTHGMFICKITEARSLSDHETMTYTYYHNNVKPKPQPVHKKGFVCKICGYVYEGETLPEDYICPLCKHGAADFEPLQ